MNDNLQFFDNRIELTDDNIHVFLLNLDELDKKKFLSYLSGEETERASRLKIKEKEKQFIVARGAIRKILSTNLGIGINEINILYGKHNKPYIEDKSVEFNISHSGKYVIIVITLDSKIGVDIEKVNRDVDYQSLSTRFFSEKEKKALNSLTRSERLDAFYRVWVRKESFIKATGKGIAFGLNNFSVSLDKNNISKVNIVSENIKTENQHWYCYNLMDVNNYKTALTSTNKGLNLIFYQ